MVSQNRGSVFKRTDNKANATTDTAKIDFFEIHPNFKVRVVGNGSNMTMIYLIAQPGATLREHKHPHEHLGYCLKGEGTFRIGDKTYVISKDYSFTIPPNIPHSLKITSKEEYVAIEVFSPSRPDLVRRTFKPEETK